MKEAAKKQRKYRKVYYCIFNIAEILCLISQWIFPMVALNAFFTGDNCYNSSYDIFTINNYKNVMVM